MVGHLPGTGCKSLSDPTNPNLRVIAPANGAIAVGLFTGAAEPSGLYYYRARTYSPTWGRFLQSDLIGYASGNNLYAYVGNDPLNNTDPNGLDTYGVILSGSLTALTGVEGSISIAFNLGFARGEKIDLGVQFSGGYSAGLNVGAALGLQRKEGKKRMRQFGKVEIPQSAFIAALKMGDA